LPGQWATLPGLTGLHTIVWVMACSLISNKNLACGDGAGLNCCDMTAATGDYDMAIITLGRLYLVLSCQLTPPDAPSVL
jgi:hypothetical protein